MRKMLMIAALAAATPALAEGDRMAAVTDPLTLKECSACHIAYPPGFLPAESWRKIMATLPDHFGEDASLPEADRAAIQGWLVANAGRSRGVDPAAPPMRITELPWFKREHDGEVSAAQRDKAKSMSNCAACHQGAAQGLFEDD